MFGNSITFGYQLFDSKWTGNLETSNPSEYCYMAETCSRLGMTLVNKSIPGGTLAHSATSNDRNPLVDRWNVEESDVDYIGIDCSSNDFQYSWSSFGELKRDGSSYDKNTFYGALQIVCEGLKQKYPNAKIILFTPLKRYQTGLWGDNKNSIGKSMKDYTDAIKKISEYYGLYVVDVFEESGIDPLNESDRNYFNEEEKTTEKFYTHPNLLGHNVIADYVTEKLIEFGSN